MKASLLSRQQTTEQVVALTEMEKLYMQVGYWTLRLVLKFVPLLFRSKLPTFHELQTPNPALNQDGPDRPAG